MDLHIHCCCINCMGMALLDTQILHLRLHLELRGNVDIYMGYFLFSRGESESQMEQHSASFGLSPSHGIV